MYARIRILHLMPRHIATLLVKGKQVLTIYVQTLRSLYHVHIQCTAYNLHLYTMQPAIACFH